MKHYCNNNESLIVAIPLFTWGFCVLCYFLIKVMNMYGDLVMDSVPEKVRKRCFFSFVFFCCCCLMLDFWNWFLSLYFIHNLNLSKNWKIVLREPVNYSVGIDYCLIKTFFIFCQMIVDADCWGCNDANN